MRRESVTVVAGALQARGAIRYRRGRIEILDRYALEAQSCECYATLRDATVRPGLEMRELPPRSPAYGRRGGRPYALGASR